MSATTNRIIIFFLLACALSWFGNFGNWLWPSNAWPVPMNPLGPLLAAIAVIWYFDGRAGLKNWWRRLLRFRAPVWLYAVAFFVPLAIIIASIWLAIALGTPAGPLPPRGAAEFLILVPIMLILGPLPEEVSFRGYGQHELQKQLSPLAASLWVGLGVAIWHAPLLLGGYIPMIIALALPAVSVVYAWLYVTGRSVWPLVVLHFVQNYFGGEYFGLKFAQVDRDVWIYFVTAFYIVWAVLLWWRFGPSLGRTETID